jgi:MoaA/NifB/PqqE/SkfB family radical SAM enzyme
MEPIRSRDWYRTPQGEPRGYIRPHALRELWFHTGTACNLSCPFCLEGSKPGDNRLQLLRLADVEPFIDEACALGVEQFSFTGGEPFLAKDLVRILQRASEVAPCLVLTNGTEALQRRIEQLDVLMHAPHPVSYRFTRSPRTRCGARGGQLRAGLRGAAAAACQGIPYLHCPAHEGR